jgi:hypothetical protein
MGVDPAASPPGGQVPPADEDIQGLPTVCAHGHVDLQGICRACGAWLPVAVCRTRGCDWRSAPGEASLLSAVRHQADRGHQLRILVGGYVEQDD